MHTEHKEIPSVSLDIRGMQTKAKKEMPLHIYWKSTVKKKDQVLVMLWEM